MKRTDAQAVGRSLCDRREFLAAGFAMLLTAQSQDTTSAPSGKLYDPSWVTPVQPVTAGDNDAGIQAIEKRIKCTCGCGLDVYTCRTTDFTCPVSPKMHAQVLALAAAGNTGEQIIAAFVREHGIVILMAPPKRGFNLIGWVTPWVVVLVAGAALAFALAQWAKRGSATLTAARVGDSGASPAELEQLREALRRTEA